MAQSLTSTCPYCGARHDGWSADDPVDASVCDTCRSGRETHRKEPVMNDQTRHELFADLEFESITVSPEQHAALVARIRSKEAKRDALDRDYSSGKISQHAWFAPQLYLTAELLTLRREHDHTYDCLCIY
jgi:hypothetical protein